MNSAGIVTDSVVAGVTSFLDDIVVYCAGTSTVSVVASCTSFLYDLVEYLAGISTVLTQSSPCSVYPAAQPSLTFLVTVLNCAGVS